MKPLNHIVADLEYCKELKKLGVKQKSIFYWIFSSEGWKLTQLDVAEGGSDYEWLQSRGKLSQKSKDKMGIGIGIYHGLRKETWQNLGLTEDEYNKRLNVAYSAWTASELFEMLGNDSRQNSINVSRQEDSYTVEHIEFDNLSQMVTGEDNLANALIKILIYLLKNNIISLEEVNKNL